MPEPQARLDTRAGMAAALAFVAGFVDVVGWLALARLYTSHETGNTAAIGIDLSKGRPVEAFTHTVPVLAFVAGAAAGSGLAEIVIRRGARSVIAPGLAVEAVLVGAFLLWARVTAHAGVIPLEPLWAFDLQAALLCAAMGVQTVTFRRVDGATVRTTYITGMLTQLAEEITERLLARRDPPKDPAFKRRVVTIGGIWPAFLLGAVLGASGHARWGVKVLVAPLAVLMALAALDLVRPAGGPAGSVEERRAERRHGRD